MIYYDGMCLFQCGFSFYDPLGTADKKQTCCFLTLGERNLLFQSIKTTVRGPKLFVLTLTKSSSSLLPATQCREFAMSQVSLWHSSNSALGCFLHLEAWAVTISRCTPTLVPTFPPRFPLNPTTLTFPHPNTSLTNLAPLSRILCSIRKHRAQLTK